MRLRLQSSSLVSFFVFVCVFYVSTDQDIQTYTIAVINALFLKAPEEKRQVSFPHRSRVSLLHRGSVILCVCVCV